MSDLPHLHSLGHVHEFFDAPVVVGIDPSLTSCGVARYVGSVVAESPGTTETRALRTRLRGDDRLEWFAGQFENLADGSFWAHQAVSGSHTHTSYSWLRPRLVVVEGYSYGARAASHQMGELGGVLRLVFRRAGVRIVVVPPSTLKKFVSGRGNAAKDEMLLEAYKRFGFEAPSGDEVEALCLAKMGVLGVGFGASMDLPKAHQAALDSVDWPGVDELVPRGSGGWEVDDG